MPIVEPVSPIVWPASGCVSSIAPLPFQVVTTGAPSRSASARSSAVASAPITPPPATITGRFAPASRAAARSTSVASGRGRPRACARIGLGNDDLGGLGLDVHRHVQQDRSRAPGGHRVPGAVEDERQLVHPRRLPPLLDDRLEDARVVGVMTPLELLEHAVAAHVGVRSSR